MRIAVKLKILKKVLMQFTYTKFWIMKIMKNFKKMVMKIINKILMMRIIMKFLENSENGVIINNNNNELN